MGSFSGKQQSEEAIAKTREGTQRYWTPERRAEASRRKRGLKNTGEPATGYSIILQYKPYRVLHGQQGHPLAHRGAVREHRKVLYDAVGPGPHECHWNETYGCGRISLEWGGLQGDSLCVDHLDHDRTNNAPENLVPSCIACNLRRGRERKVM